MKLALLLTVAVLVVLFVIWNFVGSGEHHKSKNINRLFDILLMVSLLVVLILGVNIWYGGTTSEEELTTELSQYYEGDVEEDYDRTKVSNYSELQDHMEQLGRWNSVLKDAE